MIKTVKMPKLSANMENGILVSWNKQPGDAVKKGDVLFEVETDKVVSEVESLEDGKLNKILFEEGDSVKVDETIAEIQTAE
ncbi:MAG TPA: hypothetical protein DCM73_05970 [Clostridiales bacterium]|nr:hypothetical protein [Clostridiales bacterium]